jgi:hypothetical protein
MIARMVRAFAAWRKPYEEVDHEWRDIVATLVADRAQRRRWFVVWAALLACAFVAAAIVAVAVALRLV